MSISPVNDIDGHDEFSMEINVPVIQDLNDNTYIDVGTKEPPDIIIAPDPDQSPTKKIKLSSSSVRQYFEANQTVYNPKLKKMKLISRKDGAENCYRPTRSKSQC